MRTVTLANGEMANIMGKECIRMKAGAGVCIQSDNRKEPQNWLQGREDTGGLDAYSLHLHGACFKTPCCGRYQGEWKYDAQHGRGMHAWPDGSRCVIVAVRKSQMFLTSFAAGSRRAYRNEEG